MRRSTFAAVLAPMLLLASCAGNTSTGAAKPSKMTSTPSESASTPTAVESRPTYVPLSKRKLAAALAGIEDLPPGYSQDPPTPPTNKTFCDYKPRFTPSHRVSRDFTKGGGLSSEFLRFALYQYSTPEEAKGQLAQTRRVLKSCKEEIVDGTELTYALMSAPDLGDDSLGVSIDVDGSTLVQNYALVGPTIVVTAGGGLMSTNADLVVELLVDQVKRYTRAATD